MGVGVGVDLPEAKEDVIPPTLTMNDVVVRDTRGKTYDLTYGDGLGVANGAAAVVNRAVFERNSNTGIWIGTFAGIAGTPTAELNDVVVRDTHSRGNDKFFGRGLNIEHKGKVAVTRAVFERNREVGVLLFGDSPGEPPELTLRDVVIKNTLGAECADIPAGQPLSCAADQSAPNAGSGGGVGLAAVTRGAVDLSSFEIYESAQCGVQIARDATVVAEQGGVHHNAIGLNLQVTSYNLSTVMGSSVRWYANGKDLDVTKLPLPEPVVNLSTSK
jgi:hypothetical protein